MLTETIEWVPVAERLPDADETVLIFAPTANNPVMEGCFDGAYWCDTIGSTGLRVTHWCAMPKGPSK